MQCVPFWRGNIDRNPTAEKDRCLNLLIDQEIEKPQGLSLSLKGWKWDRTIVIGALVRGQNIHAEAIARSIA